MCVRLRLLEPDQVAGTRDRLETRVRNPVPEDGSVRWRDEAIALAPDDQGRRGDAVQPLLEPVLGDREVKLGGRPEAAHEADEELDLLFGAVVLFADQAGEREHLLRGRTGLIVEEIRHQLVRHVPEEVDDGRLVAPQSDRGRQRQAADLARAQGGDLRRQPAAERLADDVRLLELECLDDVEDVEEQIPLVVQQLESSGSAEAWEERGVDAIVAAEQGEGALPGRHPARPVQEQKGLAGSGLEHLDRGTTGPEIEHPRRGHVAHPAAPTFDAPSTNWPGLLRALAASGFGQTTSS